ncbi:hypothetical protein KIN20_027534 [Parelaphostrongylus tenuis]|uniref:Uncharacterized protein n=1 Tax=Parelaphostrongylus tenuis TaxID=148309 RepID=A0AAD5QZG0_PARTN|nr:hypothetical protein KIN20_027534 [Parelaphostrongylus tenuis]
MMETEDRQCLTPKGRSAEYLLLTFPHRIIVNDPDTRVGCLFVVSLTKRKIQSASATGHRLFLNHTRFQSF